MIDLNNFQSINLSQFSDSVEFRSGSGYHLVIDFCIVMYCCIVMLMILMKFSFVLHTFFRIFFFLGSGSGSWFYFGFQYQICISYIDTHQSLFGSANSFESYVSTWKVNVRTVRQPDRQTDGKFFVLVLSSKTYKTWTFVKKREFFFWLMRLQCFLFLHTPYVMRK